MSEFRRRLLLKNANKGSIKLPTYDEATYPYTALLKGTFASEITDSTGIASGYSFVVCNKNHTSLSKISGIYIWKGGGVASRAITYVSSDGVTWQQYGDITTQTAKTYLTAIEETIYDNILSA